jgi:hypothetical protein
MQDETDSTPEDHMRDAPDKAQPPVGDRRVWSPRLILMLIGALVAVLALVAVALLGGPDEPLPTPGSEAPRGVTSEETTASDDAEAGAQDPDSADTDAADPDDPSDGAGSGDGQVPSPGNDDEDSSAGASDSASGRFAGTIVSDDGSITIVVAKDGSVSGSFDISGMSGSLSGRIAQDNIIGAIGLSEEGAGDSGAVPIRAVPVGGGLDRWEITTDSESAGQKVFAASAR